MSVMSGGVQHELVTLLHGLWDLPKLEVSPVVVRRFRDRRTTLQLPILNFYTLYY